MHDLTTLIAERDEARKDMDTFTKLNRNKTWQVAIKKADKVLNIYCGIKFDRKDFKQHPDSKIVDSACGKKVTLYVRGSKIYDGTIAYLKRWWFAVKKYRTFVNKIERLQ